MVECLEQKKIRAGESPLIAENPTVCDYVEMARGPAVCSIDFLGSRGSCKPACPPLTKKNAPATKMKIRETNSPILDRAKIDLPLFDELGQTSQDSCVSDPISVRSRDIWPNSPKSGKSIFLEKVASRFRPCWSPEFCHCCFAIFPLFGILSGPKGVIEGGI